MNSCDLRRFRAPALAGPILACLALTLVALLAPARLQAQVSLNTAVELAQRNSSAVKLAQADLSKASALLDRKSVV